jgi:hypothetical protein
MSQLTWQKLPSWIQNLLPPQAQTTSDRLRVQILLFLTVDEDCGDLNGIGVGAQNNTNLRVKGSKMDLI